ncbi:MAG TPA: hypothetical protein VLT84_08075 [Acidobacteriota bacterium]|nr:hypothetical protein [Acidobacteriota bacterium]
MNRTRPHAVRRARAASRAPAAAILLVALAVTGCEKSMELSIPVDPYAPSGDRYLGSILGAGAIETRGDAEPSGVVSVNHDGASLRFWPYTGAGFDGTPSDPVHLIFRGNADPLTLRAALMNLDGDRTAAGFPPVAPFNQRWRDAFGDVQTGWAEGEGWSGSVVQLALGDYAPVRVHLRLFRTAAPTGGTWTLGAAHFEVLIPGTTEHQVLSWMLARHVVVADLARTGLLIGPPASGGVVSAAPSFREIPAVIYNGLPPELRALTGGPAGDQSSPVPIPSDGEVVILSLGGSPNAGTADAQTLTLNFDQVIPKPLCSDGPYDWVYVQGPVTLRRSASVDAEGRYRYSARATGTVTVTPVDITANPPAPIGTPFTAEVAEHQEGFTGGNSEMVFARSKRIAAQNGGAELLMRDLRVASRGEKLLRTLEQCLQPLP